MQKEELREESNILITQEINLNDLEAISTKLEEQKRVGFPEMNTQKIAYPETLRDNLGRNYCLTEPFTPGAVKNLISICRSEILIFSVTESSMEIFSLLEIVSRSEAPYWLRNNQNQIKSKPWYDPSKHSVCILFGDNHHLATLKIDQKTHRILDTSFTGQQNSDYSRNHQPKTLSEIEILGAKSMDPSLPERFYLVKDHSRRPKGPQHYSGSESFWFGCIRPNQKSLSIWIDLTHILLHHVEQAKSDTQKRCCIVHGEFYGTYLKNLKNKVYPYKAMSGDRPRTKAVDGAEEAVLGPTRTKIQSRYHLSIFRSHIYLYCQLLDIKTKKVLSKRFINIFDLFSPELLNQFLIPGLEIKNPSELKSLLSNTILKEAWFFGDSGSTVIELDYLGKFPFLIRFQNLFGDYQKTLSFTRIWSAKESYSVHAFNSSKLVLSHFDCCTLKLDDFWLLDAHSLEGRPLFGSGGVEKATRQWLSRQSILGSREERMRLEFRELGQGLFLLFSDQGLSLISSKLQTAAQVVGEKPYLQIDRITGCRYRRKIQFLGDVMAVVENNSLLVGKLFSSPNPEPRIGNSNLLKRYKFDELIENYFSFHWGEPEIRLLDFGEKAPQINRVATIAVIVRIEFSRNLRSRSIQDHFSQKFTFCAFLDKNKLQLLGLMKVGEGKSLGKFELSGLSGNSEHILLNTKITKPGVYEYFNRLILMNNKFEVLDRCFRSELQPATEVLRAKKDEQDLVLSTGKDFRCIYVHKILEPIENGLGELEHQKVDELEDKEDNRPGKETKKKRLELWKKINFVTEGNLVRFKMTKRMLGNHSEGLFICCQNLLGVHQYLLSVGPDFNIQSCYSFRREFTRYIHSVYLTRQGEFCILSSSKSEFMSNGYEIRLLNTKEGSVEVYNNLFGSKYHPVLILNHEKFGLIVNELIDDYIKQSRILA